MSAVLAQSYGYRLADAMESTAGDDETIASWAKGVRKLAAQVDRLRPRPGRKTVHLTNAQLDAAMAGLDCYLQAGTYEECLIVFGTPQGVKAAERARDEMRAARYRSHARQP
jgi:hypothetical protein